MISVKMKYAEYINEWNDCATVKDSYDSETKTISVLIPDYIYDMWKTIPAEDIEAYKEELIASGNVRYAKTGRVVSIYCEDLKGAKMSDFVDNAPAWVEKAIKIANRA